MRRIYTLDRVGAGTHADPFRPAVPLGVASYNCTNATGGKMFVVAEVSPAQHALVAAANHLPPDGDNADATMATLSAEERDRLRTQLDALHVPSQAVTGTMTTRYVARLVRRRLLLRQHLGADDWEDTSLDALVNTIPADRRARIRDRLIALGYDTSAILGSDTIRVMLDKLLVRQDVPATRVGDGLA